MSASTSKLKGNLCDLAELFLLELVFKGMQEFRVDVLDHVLEFCSHGLELLRAQPSQVLHFFVPDWSFLLEGPRAQDECSGSHLGRPILEHTRVEQRDLLQVLREEENLVVAHSR